MAKEKGGDKTATLKRSPFKLCHHKNTFDRLRGQYEGREGLSKPHTLWQPGHMCND